MRDSRKQGKKLLLAGVLFIIVAVANFWFASSKMEEAAEIEKINEVRASVRKENANFYNMVGYINVGLGVGAFIWGIVKIRRGQF